MLEKNILKFIKEYNNKGNSFKLQFLEKFSEKDFLKIIEITNFLKHDCPYKQRLWHINNNLFTIPKCENENCTNDVPYNKNKNKYFKYCCKDCIYCENRKEKTKTTNLKKYGTNTPIQNQEIRQKTIETNQKKYNVDFPLQSKNIRNKIKNNLIENHDIENVFQRDDIKEKTKNTNLQKYGVENPMQSSIVKEKTIKTNLERYGFNYALSNDEIKNKIKKSLAKVDRQEVKNKTIKTNMERYGVENPMQDPEIFQRSINSLYNYKSYKLPSGIIIKLQRI